LAEAAGFPRRNRPLKFRLRFDQFRQTFKPELDIAKQLCREILRPELALAEKFPLLRGRVRPAVTADESPYLHGLFRGHFPLFPVPVWQVLAPNRPASIEKAIFILFFSCAWFSSGYGE
jgi:hypothetical protein